MQAEIRRCLEECDVSGMRRAWRHLAPHLPQPVTDQEVLATIHRARTEAQSIVLPLRAYSHCWLIDHGLPSGLPDVLRTAAERLYPRVVTGVGISVNARSSLAKAAAKIVQKAMADAVEEAYADGRTDPVFVSRRMAEARDKIMWTYR